MKGFTLPNKIKMKKKLKKKIKEMTADISDRQTQLKKLAIEYRAGTEWELLRKTISKLEMLELIKKRLQTTLKITAWKS